ncbi:helix-turn-helix protein [Rhodococcus sp. SMB37]|uniref:helix-turn-helix domain-containing protein n=1 Tax=Rhodococcus sp. SMB37 TaxID=2512213 RepID=UPI001050E8A6|nr:helix-turn-helix domain-containing protein [Rhodococcus sp. SMB37]TCN49153.1 helix-turn-helix protein [Rhodococcus sp. SMB37]
MSIEAITWTLEHAAIPSPTPPGMPSAPALTLVLLGLANHASRNGDDAYPSVRTLARYARMSERQVQRCLSTLVELELITRGDQERVAATISREDRRPICYNLCMPRGDAPSPRPKSRGDMRVPDGVTAEHERGDAHVTRTVLEPRDKPAAPSRTEPPARTAPAAQQQHPHIDDLATACRRAGLTARFDTLTAEKATLIAHAVDVHGIDALVRAALERHRPNDPARSAAAWISIWQELRPPQPKLPPTCGQCDEYGWLPDDDLGRAVRCSCRRKTRAPSAKPTYARTSNASREPRLPYAFCTPSTASPGSGHARPAARVSSRR